MLIAFHLKQKTLVHIFIGVFQDVNMAVSNIEKQNTLKNSIYKNCIMGITPHIGSVLIEDKSCMLYARSERLIIVPFSVALTT